MNKEDRVLLFGKELGEIKDIYVRKVAQKMIEDADDYFFSVPASSSGKYHPEFSRGEGGLVRHTKCVVFFAICAAEAFSLSSRDRDLIILAALAHDIKKQGDGYGMHTVKEHPTLAAKYFEDTVAGFPEAMTRDEIVKVSKAISSHMGKWGAADGLPIPMSEFDKCLHTADYIASRKQILAFDFGNDVSGQINFDAPVQAPVENSDNPAEYVISFGKFKGKTIDEVSKIKPQYLDWVVEQKDFSNKEAQLMISKFLNGGNTASEPATANAASSSAPVDDLPF